MFIGGCLGRSDLFAFRNNIGRVAQDPPGNSHISHLGKPQGNRKIIFESAFGKGYVSSQEGISLVISQLHHRCLRETLKVDDAVVYDAAAVHDHDWQMHTIIFEKFSKICLIYIYIHIHPWSLTFDIAPEKLWLEDCFPIGFWSLFRGELLHFGARGKWLFLPA